MLSAQNYKKGLLIDDQVMGGVSPLEGNRYLAFIISHETGEYLGAHEFDALEPALSALNRLPRNWVFEAATECGGCAKGACESGKCSKVNRFDSRD